MRISALAQTFGVPTLCVSIVLSTFSPVLANGIKSQWKARLPQGAPMSDTYISGTISIVPSEAKLSKKENDLIAMIVRRNVRAANRRAAIAQNETPQVLAIQQRKIQGQNDYDAAMQRARVAIKNYKSAQTRCTVLHTHARAECLVEAQRQSRNSL